MGTPTEKKPLAARIKSYLAEKWQYASVDVWHDTTDSWRVNTVKTINLSVRSFMSADLQSQACAMTYRTLLAIVPALALLLAIGRGFGLQSILVDGLYRIFPSQKNLLDTIFGFVDSYLTQASEGIFVGVGIIFLLWTLISLLSSVEDSFNKIWRVETMRTIWRKITDYLAILLILPILIICAGGLQILVSTTVSSLLPFDFLKPAIAVTFDGLSVVLTWLFFTGAYMLIPNSRVRFVNALIAGIFVGSAFQLLQWLFISGQMYVAKYNAIYGSFSFLPLLLIWLQLVWLITLIGALLCYASQNFGQFNFSDDIANISPAYRRKIELAIMAIIARRFADAQPPLNIVELSRDYRLPINLTTIVVQHLHAVGLINYISGEQDNRQIQPAVDVSSLTVADVIRRLQTSGASDFIPAFDTHNAPVIDASNKIIADMAQSSESILIKDIAPTEF